MWRWVLMSSSVILLGLNGCLPADFFPNLLGDSIYALTGVGLSEALAALTAST
jgi:hypothetical protein